jgi:hypothetical protein
MALRNERDELHAAWRALAEQVNAEGWRTIRIASSCTCPVLAGRHFPGNEESVLIGFPSIRASLCDRLPRGRGFVVSRAQLRRDGIGRVWIALSRQGTGRLDLFTMMAVDILSSLEGLRGVDDERLFQIFLDRIHAWQYFMSRDTDFMLGPEAELGLFGEIEFLRHVISVGMEPTQAVEAWQGPLDGLHDFVLGTGAIEVKSSVSPAGFPAVISSLDQLDDSLVRPLFVAGLRFVLGVSGRTLPENVRDVRDALRTHARAMTTFDSRLVHAGFFDAVAERYTRRFSLTRETIVRVSDSFPRLTRACVPAEIRQARYEVDLDLLPFTDLQLIDTIRELGAIAEWS